jgi:tRNA A-37 threonylcarbamoyl transferase component Bud32
MAFESYLLTEKIEPAVDLRGAVTALDDLPEAERRPKLWNLIEETARLIRRLHQHQLSHRDLKAVNVLVRGPSDLCLIDLVGLRSYRRMPASRAIQNLARMHTSFLNHPSITNSAKARFLRAYLRWGLRGKHNWKWWWREVAKATSRKLVQNQRTGRIVS